MTPPITDKLAVEVESKERPILFSGAMVRALLDGTKTQTRRVVKPQPIYGDVSGLFSSWQFKKTVKDTTATLYPNGKAKVLSMCPYGQPGDRLWVRETHLNWWKLDEANPEGPRLFSHVAAFAADGYELEPGERWIPSIHMLRAASRILLEITEVRVERLQDCSAEDAAAEGWPGPDAANSIATAYPIAWYSRLWNEINGAGAWESNPWVWAVSFKRITPEAA